MSSQEDDAQSSVVKDTDSSTEEQGPAKVMVRFLF